MNRWCSCLVLSLSLVGLQACDPGGSGPTDGSVRRDATTDTAPREGGMSDVVSTIEAGPAMCGNGMLERGENCDDGNTRGRDGCSGDCMTVEPDYRCDSPGRMCTRTSVCGDGVRATTEQCDDRNMMSGDGCSSECVIEEGWQCPLPGIACRAARCGDRLRVDQEACDDGNAMAGDGCSASCQLEDGFLCANPGQACTRTQCGDRRVEGTEQCDDGNTRPFDGCDPNCRREPSCTNGTCEARCGDGVRQPAEQCDDGNTRANDGCSATCSMESGFRCTDQRAMEPMQITVPIVYRDFRGRDLMGGHADFEGATSSERGIVRDRLGSDGRPVYAHGDGSTPTTNGQRNFDQWYRDVMDVNVTIVDRLTLTRTGTATYVFDNTSFFPLDGRGWISMGRESPRNDNHNFHFTSELRYWFEYRGGEELSFRGDDDVWVFINGMLAVDLGGVHGAEEGSVTLNAANATRFSLRMGGVYEAVVFQAERHTSESSYRLTLNGFNAPRSTCESECGDGIVTRFEACDDRRNDGSYGGCAPGCQRLGPRCGDGMLDAMNGEQCDDGNTVSGDGCASTCRQDVPG